jgi:hypothetical protein
MNGIGKFAWLAGILLIFFAGCGVTPTATTDNTGASGNNTTPPTKTSGPIALATDHSSYAPTDIIHVTVTNTTDAPVYVLTHQASCSILTVEYQKNGSWIDVSLPPLSLARCSEGIPTTVVPIAAGTTYQANIMAGYLRQGDAAFPVGQYRLGLHFANKAPTPGGGIELPSPQATYSAVITVDSKIPAQPTSAVPTTNPGPVKSTATVSPAH